MQFSQKTKLSLACFCVSLLALLSASIFLLALSTVLEYSRTGVAYSFGKLQFGEGYFLSDQLLGWRLIPNVKIQNPAGETLFQTDRFGFRNSYKDLPKKSKAILFGDSFVQGYYLKELETISAQLERRLNGKVLNFGVGGYSTDQEFILAREALKKIETEWIVLFLYSNDLPYLTRSKAWRKEKPRFLMENGKFAFDKLKTFSFAQYSGEAFSESLSLGDYKPTVQTVPIQQTPNLSAGLKAVLESRLLRVGAFLREPKRLWSAMGRGILLGDFGKLLRLEIEPQLGREAYRKSEYLDPYWDLSFQFFSELKKLSENKGSRLLVFYIPEYAQIERGERYFEPQRGFLRWCKKTQMECLEPHQEFAKIDTKTALYFRDDGHLSPAGAELAASLVSEYISSRPQVEVQKNKRVGLNTLELQ